MAKKLIFNYIFDASAQTLTLTDDVYPKRRLLMVTNVTDGEIIYLFNDSTKGGTFAFDYENYTTTITLDYDTTGMDDADDLQIFVEWDNQNVELDDSYVDPVSKIRVSQPENLIDTDFEYGLQSTKWETLELTKNIPTFYSRNGDISFSIVDITVQANSDTVTVVTEFDHGLQRGTPILVQGTSSVICDGGFTSLSIIDSTTFSYKAKSTLSFTGSIKTTNTEVFQGSIYSGTEFKIRSISGIVSDAVANNSTLTVTTEYPTDFVAGTQFALTNSFATAEQSFNTDNVKISNTVSNTQTVTIGVVTAEAGDESIVTMSTIQPNNWQARDNRSIYIDPDEVSVNSGDIYFTNGHNRTYSNTDNDRLFSFYYNIPSGETEIGGLTRGKFYIGRYIDQYRLRIYPYQENTGTTTTLSSMFGYNALNDVNKITITSIPSRGLFKHHFLGGYQSQQSYTSDLFYAQGNRSYYNPSGTNSYKWNVPSRSHINVYTTSDNSYDYADIDGKHIIISDSSETFGVDGGGCFTRYGSVIGDFESLSATSNQVFYIYGGSSYYRWYPSTTGSGRMSLSTTTNDAIHVPLILRNDRNSIYLQNHGYNTGDTVVYSLTSGTAPTGLVNNRTYKVTKVSDDRFRLQYNNADVELTDYGSSGAVLSFSVLSYAEDGDTIQIPSNAFQEGDEVTYNNASGTNIGGLTNGSKYYIYRKSGDRFRLASNSALVTGNVANNFWLISSRFNSTTNIIQTSSTHNFVTGRAVLYTQVSGTLVGALVNGGMYYVRSHSSITFSLHYTAAEANSDTNRITVSVPSAQPVFTETYAVDLTSIPSTNEVQALKSSFVGAADGNYTLASTAADQNSFTLSSNATIEGREIVTTVSGSFIGDISAFYYPDHGLSLGADVEYTSSQTHFTGLTSGTTYYAIPLDRNRFQLAATSEDAVEGTEITLTNTNTSTGLITDAITFQGSSIVAAAVGNGTISCSADSNVLVGSETLFNSLFKSGDTIKVSAAPEYFGLRVSNVSTDSFQLYASTGSTTVVDHGMSTGDAIIITGTYSFSANNTVTNNQIYYIRSYSANTFYLYYTKQDAEDDSNRLNVITSFAGNANNLALLKLSGDSAIITKTIDYVNSNTQLEVTEDFTDAITDGNYYINSQLLLRPDGFALHRPYDGGVELIPPKNPDSQMIRQTRKYFRYQSGKGIQVSFAVNFSPTTQIDTAAYNGSGDLVITTRFPHRLTSGLEIEVTGATGSNASLFNGTRTVSSVTDDYTAVFDTGTTNNGQTFSGNAEFYVKEWANSDLRCGLYDDQNGMFFSFNGSTLSCAIRSSIRQISGTVQTRFRNGNIIGTNTKFLSQVTRGGYIVIKGQSYLITKITSDTLLHISPSYRGVDAQGVIVTVTETDSVTQENWNLDKADGTGYTGFQLDLSKIQMAYIDYSWYGAGKVRFGFKDQHGKVQYVHEFVHGNFKTEAYMRSGNMPARYEIQNTGLPTYVPALAHWGTSVIMDGRFDDDKAYVFNASGANISLTGSNSITFVGEVETTSSYFERKQGFNYLLNYGVHVEVPSTALQAAFSGVGISGADLQANTKLALPRNFYATYYSPYQPSVLTRIGTSKNTESVRTLMLIDRAPTAVATADPNTGLTTSTYTLDLDAEDSSAVASDITRKVPLISVRLAPSVDTSTVGKLGEREIINRMQLILNQVSILSTHTAEVELILNGLLSTNDWQRVANPSLSELIIHNSSDTIQGGAGLFSFRAAGDTGTTRTQQLTTQELGDVATLGNSILGGDQPFPDGPDILTVVATLTEDPSSVSATTPYNVSGRISWSESQA